MHVYNRIDEVYPCNYSCQHCFLTFLWSTLQIENALEGTYGRTDNRLGLGHEKNLIRDLIKSSVQNRTLACVKGYIDLLCFAIMKSFLKCG